MFSLHTTRRLITPFILLLGFGLGCAPGAVAAQPAATLPTIHIASAGATAPDSIIISGVGFTPGGPVYIAIYDQWGMTIHDTRWIIASEPVLQPPQGIAPGEGFSFDTGGNIGESFRIRMVERPSSLPDGNQNLALNGPSGRVTAMVGIDCDAILMDRAFDRSTVTWSNVLDIELGCTG